MDTKKGSAEASMPKLQKRKFSVLKVIATVFCVVSLAANAKMDVFAAFTKENVFCAESTLGVDFGIAFKIKEKPPTDATSYADRKQAYEYSEKELLAMYNVVQAEANAESMRGKCSVAAVVLNRYFGDNNFKPGEDITSLIVPGQFAFTNHTLEWFKEHNPSVIKAVEYATKGYDPTAEAFPDEGALYYYAEWEIGEYGKTTIINGGKTIVIDRQAYHQ